MTQREKLVELLNKQKGYTLPIWIAPQTIEIMADVLIENGVIIPPCKVGDTVWMLVTCSSTKTVYEKGKRKQEHHQHTYIRSAEMTKFNFFRVIKDIGKTVFLTKEEAEKALAKQEGEL